MKLLLSVLIASLISTLSSKAYAKDDLLFTSHFELTPVKSVEATTAKTMKGTNNFYEFKLQPLEFVTPLNDIKVTTHNKLDAYSVAKYKVAAGTPYYRVFFHKGLSFNKKIKYKIYCTKEITSFVHTKTKKAETNTQHRTCLADTDSDNKFDKIYLSVGVNDGRIPVLNSRATRSLSPFQIFGKVEIDPVGYEATNPDPSTFLTVIVGILPNLEKYTDRINSENRMRDINSEIEFHKGKMGAYIISDDPKFTMPSIILGSKYNWRRLKLKSKEIDFEIVTANVNKTEENFITFGINDGPQIGDKLTIYPQHGITSYPQAPRGGQPYVIVH